LAEILTKRNELRIGKLKSGGQSLQSGQLRPFSSTETTSSANAQHLMAPPGLSQGKVQWFGGWGLSVDGMNLRLIAWNTLYLKTNAQTEAQWLAADGEPFVYGAKGKPIKMNHHTPPAGGAGIARADAALGAAGVAGGAYGEKAACGHCVSPVKS